MKWKLNGDRMDMEWKWNGNEIKWNRLKMERNTNGMEMVSHVWKGRVYNGIFRKELKGMERETHIAYIKMFSLILATIFYVTFVFFLSFMAGHFWIGHIWSRTSFLDKTFWHGKVLDMAFSAKSILDWTFFRLAIWGSSFLDRTLFGQIIFGQSTSGHPILDRASLNTAFLDRA